MMACGRALTVGLEFAVGRTYETYGLGEIASAYEVKPDINLSFVEARV